MSADALLRELQTIGIRVWPDSGLLRFKAPAGAMTPELAAKLKAAKPELLVILAANHNGEATTDLPLLTVIAELDSLIERLCNARKFNDGVRLDMERVRRCMSPDAIREELPIMRQRAESANGGARNDRS